MINEKWDISASDVQFAITNKPSCISPDVLHMVSLLCDYESFNKSVLNPEHCLFEIPRMLLSGPNQGNISEYDIEVFKTLCDVITNPLSRYNANIIAEMFLLKNTIINDIENNLNRMDLSGGIIRYNMSDWPYTEENVARFIAQYTHLMNILNKTIGIHSISTICGSNNKTVINDNKMRLESMFKMLTFELHHQNQQSPTKELTNEQINAFINKTVYQYIVSIGMPQKEAMDLILKTVILYDDENKITTTDNDEKLNELYSKLMHILNEVIKYTNNKHHDDVRTETVDYMFNKIIKPMAKQLHHIPKTGTTEDWSRNQINRFINKTLHDYTINIGIPETIYVNEFKKLFNDASNAFVYLRNEKTIDYLTCNPETIIFPFNDDNDEPSSHKSDIRHKQIQEMYKKVLKHKIIKTHVISNIQNSKQTNS